MPNEQRIPPHSDDAEKSVLGAALQSVRALNEVCEILEPEDFYQDRHRRIFAVLQMMNDGGIHADYVTVSEELKKRHELSLAGDTAYIASLPGAAPSTSGAYQYARVVKDKSILRRLISGAADIEADGYEDKASARDVLEKAEDVIFEISKGTQKRDYTHIGDIVRRNMDIIKEHHDSGKKLTGLSTGFTDLDRVTSGLQKQDLIILAARPSEGKTALALNIALNVARQEGKRVQFFSLEMGELPLGLRLLSMLSNVELTRIRNGSVLDSDEDTRKLREAAEDLGNMNLFIDETSNISVSEMKSKCKRIAATEGAPDLVIVDYIQLMEMPHRAENRTLEIAAISRALKQMAKELDCPVIVLSQLSRISERDRRRPLLSDLRDSGAIEQDGDLIMFIHNKTDKELRQDAENPNNSFNYNPETMRQLLILKHRNGETEDLVLSWIKRYTKFGNTDYGSFRMLTGGPGGGSGAGSLDSADGGGEEPEEIPF